MRPSIVQDPREEKKASIVKTGVFILAVAFLVAGILYQMGYLKFVLPSPNAQKIQHRGASMHRQGLASADNMTGRGDVAGSTVHRGKVLPAGQAGSTLPGPSACQGGEGLPHAAVPLDRRE